MDWDCQGCEKLLANPESFKLFEDNVLALFIAVHDDNYPSLNAIYGELAMVNTGSPNYKCDQQGVDGLFRARAYVDDERKCLQESPFGPVYYRDGSLNIFNKKLFDKMGLTLHLPDCLPWMPF
jgi:hypothetical protein